MKKFFEKIKSYSFWVSLSASLILFLNALGNAFGFEIQNQIVEDCIMSFASLLAVLGIVSLKDTKKDDSLNNIDNSVNTNENLEEKDDANETNNQNDNE